MGVGHRGCIRHGNFADRMAERLGPLLPERRLEISLSFGDSPGARLVSLDAGKGWQARLAINCSRCLIRASSAQPIPLFRSLPLRLLLAVQRGARQWPIFSPVAVGTGLSRSPSPVMRRSGAIIASAAMAEVPS